MVTEKQIEAAFVKSAPSLNFQPIGIQMRLPMGILDVIALHKPTSRLTVFEIKKHPANGDDCAQVLAYARQFEDTISYWCSSVGGGLVGDMSDCARVSAYLVAPSLRSGAKRLFDVGAIGFMQTTVSDTNISFTDMFGDMYDPFKLETTPQMAIVKQKLLWMASERLKAFEVAGPDCDRLARYEPKDTVCLYRSR
jgi:hypothetical protein